MSFLYSFFYEYRKKIVYYVLIIINIYIFLIISCLNFLLDYDQLFFSIIYKKGILINNERIN